MKEEATADAGSGVSRSTGEEVVYQSHVFDENRLMMISDEALIGEVTTDDAVLTVDCGATGSLLSLHTLESWDKQGFVNVLKINPDVQKKYKVANGQSVLTCSQISVQFANKPELGAVVFDCTEAEGVPPLLGMNFLKDGVLNMAKQTLSVNGRVTKLQRRGNGHLVINLASSEPEESSEHSESKDLALPKHVQQFNIADDESDDDIPELMSQSDNDDCVKHLHAVSDSDSDSEMTSPAQHIIAQAIKLLPKHSPVRIRHHGRFQGPDRNSGASGGDTGNHPEIQRGNHQVPGRAGRDKSTEILQAGVGSSSSGTPESVPRPEGDSQRSLHGSFSPYQAGPPGTLRAAGSAELPVHDEWTPHGEHKAQNRGDHERGFRQTEAGKDVGCRYEERELLPVGSNTARRQPASAAETVGGTPPDVHSILPPLENGEPRNTCSQGSAAPAGVASRAGGRDETGNPAGNPEGEGQGTSFRRIWRRGQQQDSRRVPDLRRRRLHLRQPTGVDGEESEADGADRDETEVNAASCPAAELSGITSEKEPHAISDPVSLTVQSSEPNRLFDQSSTVKAQCGTSLNPTVSFHAEGTPSSRSPQSFIIQSGCDRDTPHEVTKEEPQVSLAEQPMISEAESSALPSTEDQVRPPSWEDAAKLCLHDNYYITATANQREAFAGMLKQLRPLNCAQQHVTRIIEFCCDEDSEIGIQGS